MSKQETTNQLSNGFPRSTVGGSYGYGWKQFLKYFLELFLISIIVLLVQAPLGGLGAITNGHGPAIMFFVFFLQLFVLAYAILFLAPIDYGASFAFLKGIRNEKVEIRDMFSGFENYLNVVLANILVGFLVGIGMFFLIIPGIFVACRLAFVRYLVIDRQLDPLEAIKASWRMTKGHGWTIFFMGLLAIPIVIAGLICLLVGVIFAAMWIRCAFATLYYSVSQDYPVGEELADS
jgi:uncharacterized membrane protein